MKLLRFHGLLAAIVATCFLTSTASAQDEPVPMECKNCDVVVVDEGPTANGEPEVAVSIPMWMYESIDAWWLTLRVDLPRWLPPPTDGGPKNPPTDCDALRERLRDELANAEYWEDLASDADAQGGFVWKFGPKMSGWTAKGSDKYGRKTSEWNGNQRDWRLRASRTLKEIAEKCKDGK